MDGPIVCCQDTRGGLVDKPGKSRDYYHTCYTLSGLSVAQHMPCDRRTVLGDPANLLVCMLGVVRGAILYYRAAASNV